ncbi:alkene reductase [Acidovorax sp. IB03]|jgi:N-ethylmaleimide reductase|uniref:alkene reductase n=1 Tax=Acidovorax TaxID=12916 RepID=UPI0018E735A5|nr:MULTISPECIES: alkene reductase [Acidovorax]MBP6579568.1 alkene reductase [Acidovorax sp.]MBJ2165679.1 alkene reductase [Acidovorax sp. IB03]WCT24450.1 alkene reductase [Acidovorax temperans]HRL54342.1 alkene reductase [Acidovorax temperans]HRM63691.1 alkene reductase [Acidovorax temperans]
MTSLFEPTHAGDIALANRIAMAPLTRNRAPDAIPTELTATYYAQRATAGLIISEATAISPEGQGYADVPGLYGTEQLDGWKKVTRAVHEAGGKIVVQLWHVGRISHTSLQPGHAKPVAPSAIRAHAKTVLLKDGVPTFTDTSEPRALDAEELPRIVQDYRHAARNAIAAGFDGVEIHAANGYLIDQFLKTGANQRTDDYGGSIKNRARLLLEVTRAIVDEIGGGRTGIRLSPVTPANDIVDENPQPLFDYVVRELGKLGLAYVHVIEGATGGPRELPDRPFDYAELRNAYRAAGGKGAWMVNNGYDRALAEAALANGADIVAFGRPFISNPDLVERLKQNAPLNELNRDTLYGGGAKGYTDYPTLAG